MDLDGFGWIWMDLDGFGCIWSGNACRKLGCSDYTANSNCTSAYTVKILFMMHFKYMKRH